VVSQRDGTVIEQSEVDLQNIIVPTSPQGQINQTLTLSAGGKMMVSLSWKFDVAPRQHRVSECF
jgi:hypothetical protein